MALEIWRASKPAFGSPVEVYLRHRNIQIPVPPSLRYNAATKYRPCNQYLPAMIAAVQAPDRHITAIHRTYLRLDGQGKAGVNEPKMALGPFGQGAVRLAKAGPVLGIAEGIETGLAAMQLFEIPVWCALGSRLHRVALPDVVTRVIVLADNGTAGMEAANKAVRVFFGQSRDASLCVSDLGDFNDVLIRRQAACLRR